MLGEIVHSWTLSLSQREQLSDWMLQPLVTFDSHLGVGPFELGYLHYSGAPGASSRSGTETALITSETLAESLTRQFPPKTPFYLYSNTVLPIE